MQRGAVEWNIVCVLSFFVLLSFGLAPQSNYCVAALSPQPCVCLWQHHVGPCLQTCVNRHMSGSCLLARQVNNCAYRHPLEVWVGASRTWWRRQHLPSTPVGCCSATWGPDGFCGHEALGVLGTVCIVGIVGNHPAVRQAGVKS